MDHQNINELRPEDTPCTANMPLTPASSPIRQQFTATEAHPAAVAAQVYGSTVWTTQPQGTNNATYATFPYASELTPENHLSGNYASSGRSSLLRGDMNAPIGDEHSMLLKLMRTHDARCNLEEQLAAYNSVNKEIPPPTPMPEPEMSLADAQHLYQSPGSDYEPPIQQADMYMPENYAKFHDGSFGPGQFTDALFSEDALSEEDFEDPAIDDMGQDTIEPIQQVIDNAGQSSIGLIQQAIEIVEQNAIDPIQQAIEIAPRALVADTSVYLNNDLALGDAYEISQSSRIGSSGPSVAVGLPEASAHINRAITRSPLQRVDDVIEPRIRYAVDNHTKQLVSNLSPESLHSILLETLSKLPPAYKEYITSRLRASSSIQEYCPDGNANTGNFKLPIECNSSPKSV
jgi:hypothetical protein